MKRFLFIVLSSVFVISSCQLQNKTLDISGNYALDWYDNLRVYFNGELVAEFSPEEGGEFPVNDEGDTVNYDEICGEWSEAGIPCPSDTYWNTVGIHQPQGPGYSLLNVVNLSEDVGEPGARLPGLVNDDLHTIILVGLGIAADETCTVLGITAAEADFVERTDEMETYDIENGVLSIGYAEGCEILPNVVVSANLVFETDFTGTRIGDFDISSVDAGEPIDEEGEPLE